MKKYFIFAAAVAFTACTNDTLIDNTKVAEKDVAIGFGTMFNGLTRAVDPCDDNVAENDKAATAKYGLSYFHNQFYMWGYKKIADKYQMVFNGNDVDNDTQSLVTYMGADVDDWTYAPLRYWDKSAAYYNFYAVAPATIDDAYKGTGFVTWKAAEDALTVMNDVYDVRFSINNFKVDGKSLAQNAEEPTASDKSLFATDNTKNPDLMIANDHLQHSLYTNDKVNFEFNHILSRLNIAVKSSVPQTYNKKQAHVTYTTTGDTNVPVFKKGDLYYIKDSNNKAQQVGYNSVDKSAEKVGEPGEEWDATLYEPVMIDDTADPTSGVVKITELKVYNLKDQGSFNEVFGSSIAETLTDEQKTLLSNGTDKRWTAVFSNTTNKNSEIGVSFVNTDNPTNHTKEKSTATDTEYINGSTDATAATNVLTDKYNYFYQGLVIPQTVKYEACELNGSDVYDFTNNYALANKDAFLKITYTIDGDSFTAFYNLAQVFNNVEAAYVHPTFGSAYRTDDGDFAFEKIDGTTKTYHRSDGTVLDEEPEWFDGDAITSGTQRVAVKTKELADRGVCDITFCEGWQNNLMINISPAAIYVTGSVFEWATYKDNIFDVE